MLNVRFTLILVIGLGLAACGSPYPMGKPAPVESRGEVIGPRVTVEADPAVQVQAYKPPQQVALARPAPPSSRAVRNLMQRAEAQRQAGEYAAAQVSLERALRIEPGNAQLWNRLAHLHLLQQAYARAEQFASKSNSLSQADDALSADNWSLIAQARRALGNAAGARQASERARGIRY